MCILKWDVGEPEAWLQGKNKYLSIIGKQNQSFTVRPIQQFGYNKPSEHKCQHLTFQFIKLHSTCEIQLHHKLLSAIHLINLYMGLLVILCQAIKLHLRSH